MTGIIEASLVAQTVRKLPAMLETQVLCDLKHKILEALLKEKEKAMAPHSSTLAWKIP